MDEVKRLRMRRAHADRSIRCACGRQVWGNGEKSHRRACRVNLREQGWPLASSWIETFVDAGLPGAETLRRVERGLGQWALDHETDREAHGHPRQPDRLPWQDFKALIWSLTESSAD